MLVRSSSRLGTRSGALLSGGASWPENTAIYRTGATLALKMAARACSAAAGALGRAVRACFGAAGALKMALRPAPVPPVRSKRLL